MEGSDLHAVGYYRAMLVRCAPRDLHDLVARNLSDGSARWELSEHVVLSSDQTLSDETWERLESAGVEGIWHAKGRAWFPSWD